MLKKILAQGRYENDLYILSSNPHALLVASPLKASFELWHLRLGHVSFETILLLNKMGSLFVTSILPKLVLCPACQMFKVRRLSFDINVKRALHPFNLVHCDFWGPLSVSSTDGYRYYALFVDEFPGSVGFTLYARNQNFILSCLCI